ncbi:hypothetical protein FDH02_gp17 [Pseudomonas phage VSW-3]|uniref:Uncharacterized protein n=1 Tax=Pseudomonas phage VSW-3 TaxID=1852562 RepID=A0A173GD00_9CAUD|nr:hypothetical protein FDH02_gp17 [Pseudomonas phage VSW-3]ANH51093.1 hypothetical protein VSW3_17 [Pseudomonas phage VSW-3]
MYFYSFKDGELGACQFSDATARRLVLVSLYALHREYTATGWDLTDPESALKELEDHSAFVFIDDRVICLSESKPWFSNEPVVSEEFVTDGIRPEQVKQVIEAVCRLMGVRRYAVGTRAVANGRHAGLSKLYQQEGLTVSTVELTGVVDG